MTFNSSSECLIAFFGKYRYNGDEDEALCLQSCATDSPLDRYRETLNVSFPETLRRCEIPRRQEEPTRETKSTSNVRRPICQTPPLRAPQPYLSTNSEVQTSRCV